jgi:hypothetical protein
MSPKTPINGSGNTIVTGNSNSVNINNHYYTPSKTSPSKIPSPKVIQHNPDIHINQEQQYKIKDIVDETYEMMKGYKENIHKKMLGELKRKFKLTQYMLLPKNKYSEAISYLNSLKARYRRELMLLDVVRFKEYTIPAIHARWNIYRKGEDLLDFASLKLRKNVTDLKKLSANDLDTLYTRVFSIKKARKE